MGQCLVKRGINRQQTKQKNMSTCPQTQTHKIKLESFCMDDDEGLSRVMGACFYSMESIGLLVVTFMQVRRPVAPTGQ